MGSCLSLQWTYSRIAVSLKVIFKGNFSVLKMNQAGWGSGDQPKARYKMHLKSATFSVFLLSHLLLPQLPTSVSPMCSISTFKKSYFNLSVRERRRDRDKSLLLSGSLPRWLQCPELNRCEGRSKELLLGLLHECRSPMT